MQRLYGSTSFLPQRIVDADHGGQLSGDAQVQVGIGFRQVVEFLLITLRDMAALILKHEVGAADQHRFALDHAGNAVSHHVLHLRMVLLVGKTPQLGFLHHGVGHGVGIVLLKTRSQPQHIRLLVVTEGDDLGHLGGGVGEGAGLVEHDGVGL